MLLMFLNNSSSQLVLSIFWVLLRIYQTPTRDIFFVIQMPWNLPSKNKVYSLVLANKIDTLESIFEYCTSKVGYLSDISKNNILFHRGS